MGNRKWIYNILSDKNNDIFNVFTVGDVISYISMLFNLLAFCILCRKNLISPATILMQGLAVADFLTALSSYGLEPLFQYRYECSYSDIDKNYSCFLPYPYCFVATHLSVLSAMFHTVSNLLTTFLGIQKVIAIMFPIWTRTHLSNRKAIHCCVLTFLLCIFFSIPRHFVLDFQYDPILKCTMQPTNTVLLKYSSLYYIFIQTLLVTGCCIIMFMSTSFIIYKLVNNKFHGRMTEHRRQERRSVVMVVIVLVVFLITEIPKLCSNLWFCITYVSGGFTSQFVNDISWSIQLLVKYEHGVAQFMGFFTDDAARYVMKYDDEYISWKNINFTNIYNKVAIFFFSMEMIKVLTVVGCLSNFIIYIIMSSKLRKEIALLFQMRS